MCLCVCVYVCMHPYVQIAWEGKLSNPFVGIWRQNVTEECYDAHMYIHMFAFMYVCIESCACSFVNKAGVRN